MKRAACFSIAFFALTSFAHAGDLQQMTFPAATGPDSHGVVDFDMPSGNVSCNFIPGYFKGQPNYDGDDAGKATLTCERMEPTRIYIYMGEVTKPYSDVADWDGDDEHRTPGVLAYDHSWKGGPFECISRTDGLSCTRTDGHGFHVSKAKVDIF